MTPDAARTPLLKSKLFWVGVLYFSEGFPLGVFYEIFPVYFRQQGVELRQIGVLSLLGLGVLGWLSAQAGWLVQSGRLYWTTDGGQTWARTPLGNDVVWCLAASPAHPAARRR